MLTPDYNVFAQVKILDCVAQSLDVKLALEMPYERLGVEHIT